MSEQNQQLPATETAAPNWLAPLNTFMITVKEKLPIWEQRAARATAALSAITEVSTEEQDKAAEVALVRTKMTYDEVSTERLSLTKFTDDFKARLMLPENLISPTRAGNEYARVKALRDERARGIAKKIADEKAAALADQKRREEIARLNKVLEDRFFNNIVAAAAKIRERLYEHMKTFTLANFETCSSQIRIKPSLKLEIFNSWFEVETSLNPEDLNKYLTAVKEQYTYESINTKYQEQAQPIVDEYVAKLPALKEELTLLSQKSEEQRIEAEKLRDEKAAAELQRQKDEDAQKLIANQQKTTDAHNSEKLEATFAAQLVLQNAAPLKGVTTKRVAQIDCAPSEIVKVFSQVLFACFSNTKFPGYIKTDKTGNPLPVDADGIQAYQDWAQDLLDFYATYCNQEIEGITFKEKISTRQNKAKK